MKNDFVAGLDGGGTKTALVVLDVEGRCVDRQVFGPLNPNGNAEQTIRQTLLDALSRLHSLECSVRQIVIGAAGVSNPQCAALLTRVLREEGYQGGLAFAGDDETALRGAVGKQGVVLIAGTGSVCFGRNAGNEEARCGGCGHLIDDEGGGYAIGRDIFAAAARELDGRIAHTCLTRAVMEQFGLRDRKELIGYLYAPQTGKKGIAAAAPLLFQAIAQKDPAAMMIGEHAARELALLGETVVRRLNAPQSETALLGSILTQGAFICDQTKRLLKETYPELCFVSPRNDAAHGAAGLALERLLQGGNSNG